MEFFDFENELLVQTWCFGEEQALENVTTGIAKKDNIECCVCLNCHWGVKLPNCNHFICPKCYYKLFYGYISNDFYIRNPVPKHPEKPMYPYGDQDLNKKVYESITTDNTHLEWFMYENEDLYNSVMLNTEFVQDIDIRLKYWFRNNENIKHFENNCIQYKKDCMQYDKDYIAFNLKIQNEKNQSMQKRCPLCRL